MEPCTTIPDVTAPRPLDRVNRRFRADRPNKLRVSDFTYVSTWQGWLYVAFVIDVFPRATIRSSHCPTRCRATSGIKGPDHSSAFA